MAEHIETPTEEKEVTPEWATKLQESLDNLTDHLSQALKPQSEPEESPEVQEIPLPEIPQPEPPEQETPEVVPSEEPEKPKKKRLLDWLL